MKNILIITMLLVGFVFTGCTVHINPATNMTFGEENLLAETCCRFWNVGEECWAAPDIDEDAKRHIFFHYCERGDNDRDDSGSEADSSDEGNDDPGDNEGEPEGRGDCVY